MWTDDPIADFNRYDSEQQKYLKKLPVCCGCGEPIQQDDAVCIDGDWFCDDCLNDMRQHIEVK